MHTILGANGVIGQELSLALSRAGQVLRQVARNPRPVGANDQCVAADLLDAEATTRAVAGSTVAYLVAGLRYDAAVWEAQWPRVMDNAIDACRRAGCRLVFFDNVYAYGRVAGPMTEDTAFNPCSRKGEVRARIANRLLAAMKAGDVTAMIVRSADFYGPGAVNSFPYATVFTRLRAGKVPQWVGDPRAIHSFTYTPDAGQAVARLALSGEAWGQTWHLPTSPEALTGEGFVRYACEAAGRSFALQVAPRWLLAVLGLMMPVLRENAEMMYQFEKDYVFDSGRIARAFGIEATPYRKGIGCVLAGD